MCVALETMCMHLFTHKRKADETVTPVLRSCRSDCTEYINEQPVNAAAWKYIAETNVSNYISHMN